MNSRDASEQKREAPTHQHLKALTLVAAALLTDWATHGEILKVGGTLGENARWSGSNTYLVTNTVTVPLGHMLTIEAGTVVKFSFEPNPNYKMRIIVDGLLETEGTVVAPTVFTSARDDEYGELIPDQTSAPAPGDWGCIQFNNPQSTLHDAILRYGGLYGDNSMMVWLTGTSAGGMLVRDCLFEWAYHSGLQADNPQEPELLNNRFEHNGTYGIYLEGPGSALIQSNEFRWNQFPLYQGVRDPQLDGNLIEYNLHQVIAVGGTVSKDLRWRKGAVYEVSEWLTVAQGHTLTIEEGAVLKFAFNPNPNYKLGMAVNGKLELEGSATNPVVFTSGRDTEYGGTTSNEEQGPAPGDWGCIQYNNPNSTLKHALLRYGGLCGDNSMMVWLAGASAGTTTIEDCLFEWAYSKALQADAPHTPVIQQNTFQNNGCGLYLAGGGTATVRSNSFWLNRYPFFQGVRDPVLEGNLLQDNVHQILAVGGTVNTDLRWRQGSVYEVSENLAVAQGHKLTIEPGVVLKFAFNPNPNFKVGMTINGTLELLSSAGQPVVLTSARDDDYGGHTSNEGQGPAKGDWGYLRYNNANSTLHDVIIRYGGLYGDNDMMVWLSGSSAGTMNVRDCLLEWAYSKGLQVDAPQNPVIERNTFQNNGVYGLYLLGPGLGTVRSNLFRLNPFPIFQGVRDPVLTANTIMDNVHQVIAVGGSLGANLRWRAGSVYEASEWLIIPQGRTLTIEEGVVLKFAFNPNPNYKVGVVVRGGLNLLGTSARPIVLTSGRDVEYGGETDFEGQGPAKGDWACLDYENPNNVLHDVILRYGGSGAGVDALVWMNSSSVATFGIEDCIIDQSAGRAIAKDGVGSMVINRAQVQNCNAPAIQLNGGTLQATDVTFEQYGQAAVAGAPGTSISVTNCNFLDPENEPGVVNASIQTAIATGNWWGSPTGPSTVGNGQGVKVSTNTIYEPWAAGPVPPFQSPRPFRIVSYPNPTAWVGVPYRYDEDGRASASGAGASWSKLFGPELLSIDPANGAIAWLPENPGRYLVGISAISGTNMDRQLFVIDVGTERDLTSPTVTGLSQHLDYTNGNLGVTLIATFSEPVLVNPQEILVEDAQGKTVLIGCYSYCLEKSELTIRVPNLISNATYRLYLTDGITDEALNALDGEYDGHAFPTGNGWAGGHFSATFVASAQPTSQPRFTGIQQLPDGRIRLSWETSPNLPHRLEASGDLIHWATLFSTNATGAQCHWTDPESKIVANRYYRLAAP